MHNISRAVSTLGLALLLATSPVARAEEPAGGARAFPVTQVEFADIPVTYTVPGSVISDGRIEVSSRLIGFIEQLDVREGQRVSRGDLLVRIDQTDIDEGIRQAQAGVRAAQEDLHDAEFDIQKYERLARSGSVSTETLRKAKVRVGIAQATFDKARSVLVAAEAQKGYATITSPVDGVIVFVAKRSGEMATTGSTIVTVESHEVLLFKAFVAESNLAQISAETPVTVRIDTLGEAVFNGRIRGIVPSADDITRRYEINIVLPKDARLVPGMFGRADIVLGRKTIAVIPRTALTRRGGLDGVFVLDGQVARFRWLRLGRPLGDTVEVVSGLSGGETILAVVDNTVRDGAAVKTTEVTR